MLTNGWLQLIKINTFYKGPSSLNSSSNRFDLLRKSRSIYNVFQPALNPTEIELISCLLQAFDDPQLIFCNTLYTLIKWSYNVKRVFGQQLSFISLSFRNTEEFACFYRQETPINCITKIMVCINVKPFFWFEHI